MTLVLSKAQNNSSSHYIRKVNLNSYHRNRNGYCADRNRWVEILCYSNSAFATV